MDLICTPSPSITVDSQKFKNLKEKLEAMYGDEVLIHKNLLTELDVNGYFDNQNLGYTDMYNFTRDQSLYTKIKTVKFDKMFSTLRFFNVPASCLHFLGLKQINEFLEFKDSINSVILDSVQVIKVDFEKAFYAKKPCSTVYSDVKQKLMEIFHNLQEIQVSYHHSSEFHSDYDSMFVENLKVK